jgi:hypothetical protein
LQKKKGPQKTFVRSLSGRTGGNIILDPPGISISLSVQINQSLPINFQLNSGCSYTQLDSQRASSFGLKGHPELVGRSSSADGTFKIDYLCMANVTIQGVTRPLVIKVAPYQHPLLGLDAMWMFDMNIFTKKLQYDITSEPYLSTFEPRFRFIDLDYFFKTYSIDKCDLVPLQLLPPPQEAFKKLVDNGKINNVVDLGLTF